MDRDKIRAAAEKATKGPWEHVENTVWCPSKGPAHSVCSNDCRKWKCGGNNPQTPDGDGKADMDFIALTDPDTFLALLKELDEKDELIFAYDQTRTPVIDKTIIDLRIALDEAEKEKTELCKYYTKNQMLKDDMIDLVAANTRLREALVEILGCNETTWIANARYIVNPIQLQNIATKALNPARRKK